MADAPEQHEEAASEAPAPEITPEFPPAFFQALAVAGALLLLLDAILGALMWLPFFSGLLGFFVEGLIAGGVAFRFARKARPVSRGRLWSGIALLVVIGMGGLIFFEYVHFSSRVSSPPHFRRTRNKIIKKVTDEAERREALSKLGADSRFAFRDHLAENYPPGASLGYAFWATRSGEMTIELQGESQRIEAPHRGWIWPIRTTVGAVLLLVGLALAFDALKSPHPVRNVLLPGEDYEELED